MAFVQNRVFVLMAMNINWYPGHMAKTRRMILENLKLVDVVIELVDARIPYSSRNPDLDEICGNKPKIIALNKSDMANKDATLKWIDYYKSLGDVAIAIDSITGKGFGALKQSVNVVLKDKLQRDLQKGMKKRPAKMMIAGIPNVGKSSFINKLSGRAGTKTGDTPGITRAKQWIRIPGGYELLDTPGILWPRFEDEITGLRLAFTGAIRDEVYDVVQASYSLCEFFKDNFPQNLMERYKLKTVENLLGYEILEEIGKKRGCLVSGGEVDLERAARIFLEDFRSQRLGNITLEFPEDITKGNCKDNDRP
jgi:ribosome biogenesis GTPase A